MLQRKQQARTASAPKCTACRAVASAITGKGWGCIWLAQHDLHAGLVVVVWGRLLVLRAWARLVNLDQYAVDNMLRPLHVFAGCLKASTMHAAANTRMQDTQTLALRNLAGALVLESFSTACPQATIT